MKEAGGNVCRAEILKKLNCHTIKLNKGLTGTYLIRVQFDFYNDTFFWLAHTSSLVYRLCSFKRSV